MTWRSLRVLFLSGAALLSGSGVALLGSCGPFTDVAADAFCPFVLEIFTLGITTGTTATTYSPAENVTRLQMAAFLSRSVDAVLRRGGPRAPAERFFIAQSPASVGVTSLATAQPFFAACDGGDVWVTEPFDGSIARVRASDGRLLETWTGAGGVSGILAAIDGILATGSESPGKLYRIVPRQSAGAVTTVASNLPAFPRGAAFDGARIWTGGSFYVSIVTPTAAPPWTVTTVTTGFSKVSVNGVLYEGSHIWVTDSNGALLKLDSSASILQTITVGKGAGYPVFDGSNIWVPSGSNSPSLTSSVSVVRPSSGAVLATLTAVGFNGGSAAAFDGQRVLVTEAFGDNVWLWKADDLTPLGSVSMGSGVAPVGPCSDGLDFWIPLRFDHSLVRF